MSAEYLEAGRVLKPHSFKGEMKLECFCDGPEFLKQFPMLYFDERGERGSELRHVKVIGRFAVISLDGVDSEDQARAFAGKILYFKKSDAALPDGSHFIDDLTGLNVIDAQSGCTYGTLIGAYHNGANDVYIISMPGGGEELFPAVSEFVDRIVPGEGIYVKPIEGMFGDSRK